MPRLCTYWYYVLAVDSSLRLYLPLGRRRSTRHGLPEIGQLEDRMSAVPAGAAATARTRQARLLAMAGARGITWPR